MTSITVRVPATTANIGPGFDSFGMALSLWNEAEFSSECSGNYVQIKGEGEGTLPLDSENLILYAFRYLFESLGEAPPENLKVSCKNGIPISAGLGSSASAILLGLLGANAFLGSPLTPDEIMEMGCEIEGHPDNIVSAFMGGMTICVAAKDAILTRKLELSIWYVVVILPKVTLSTEASRQALPEVVDVEDAVYNIGRCTLVAEALRIGDEELLIQSMQDRLHHPYRLPLIPGSDQAIRAAQDLGAPAALSGAGPSVIAFKRSRQEAEEVADAMESVFHARGISTRSFILMPISTGIEVCTA